MHDIYWVKTICKVVSCLLKSLDTLTVPLHLGNHFVCFYSDTDQRFGYYSYKNEEKKMLLIEKHKEASTIWCQADAFSAHVTFMLN